MSGDVWREIIRQLNTVPSAASIQVGIALLDRADDRTGQVNILWADFLNLSGCQSRNAARRHLTNLKAAGIIHFSTNENVYITFLAWFDDAKTARWRAENDIDEGDDDQPVTKTARQRAENVTNDTKTARQNAEKAESRVRVELSNDLTTTNKVNNSTQLSNDQLAELPPVARWIFGLLTDEEIAIFPENAYKFALMHHEKRAAWVLKQVSAWWLKRDELAVDVLAWRLGNPGKSQAGPASPAFLASDLYARHYPLDARQLERWQSWQRNAQYADIIIGAPTDPRDDWQPGIAELVEKLPPPQRSTKARDYSMGVDHG